MSFRVNFIDRGVSPKQQPDPAYPRGIDLDLTHGNKGCKENVPYPAPRCGYYVVECNRCGFKAMITVAGRQDDPRSIKLPCKDRENVTA
jgi:hypothetical protein